MTKRELIEALEALDCPDETIVVRHTGDWRTTPVFANEFEKRRVDGDEETILPHSYEGGITVVVVWA